MPESNKKKILYVWKGPYPWDIRIDKICTSLADSGFDVYVLAKWNGEDKKEEVYKNHNIIRAGYKKNSKLFIPVSFNPFWKMEIESAIKNIKPDIIIAREIMLAEASGKAGQKHNIPMIIDMAENYPAAMRDWKKYNKTAASRFIVHKLKVPDNIEKKSVNIADGIITVCHEQNERLSREYNFDKENIQVVHNTPELEKFNTINQPFSNSPFITFGHHGHLSAEKSIKNLILAFAEVIKENKNIRLLIAGEGESYQDYISLAKKLKIYEFIEFTGEYMFQELTAIMNRIDIGVIPYQVSDFNNFTIHNKIFDYFAAGRPVIVSEARPMVRVVEETGAGISADCEKPELLADAMLNILKYDLKNMSQNGIKAFSYKYNWNMDSINLISFLRSYL